MAQETQTPSPAPSLSWQPPDAWLGVSDEERGTLLASWFGPQARSWQPAEAAACRRWLAGLVRSDEVVLNPEGVRESVPGLSDILKGLARLEGAALPPFAATTRDMSAGKSPNHKQHSVKDAQVPPAVEQEDDPEATADLHSVADMFAKGSGPSKSTRRIQVASEEKSQAQQQQQQNGATAEASQFAVPVEADADSETRLIAALVAGWRGEAQPLRTTLRSLEPGPDGALPVAPALAEALARLIANQWDLLAGLAQATYADVLERICGWWFALLEGRKLSSAALVPAWSALVERLAYRREAGVVLTLQRRFRASPDWPGLALPPAAPVADEAPAVPARAEAQPWIEALEHLEAGGAPEHELVTRLWQHAVLECDGRAPGEQLKRLHATYARLACRLDPSVGGVVELLGRLLPFRFAEPAVRAALAQLPSLAGAELPVTAGRVSDEAWQRLWSGLTGSWRHVFAPELAGEAALVWRLLVVAPDSGRLELVHRLLPALVRHLCTPAESRAASDSQKNEAPSCQAAVALVLQYGKLQAAGTMPPSAPPYWWMLDLLLERLESASAPLDVAPAEFESTVRELVELLVQAPPLRVSEIPGAAEALGRAWRVEAGVEATLERRAAVTRRLLVRIAQSEAPSLVLAALGACREPELVEAVRPVETLLEALPAQLTSTWWLPIPGSAHGQHVQLVEGLFTRLGEEAPVAAAASETERQRVLLGLWRRVVHDREGREAFVEGLAVRHPAACAHLLHGLLADESTADAAHLPWLEIPPPAHADVHGARELDEAFAVTPQIWPALLAWAGRERSRQECVGRRFERTLVHLATYLDASISHAEYTERRLAEHCASFTSALATHEAWFAYLCAAENALLTARLVAEQVSGPLWRRLAESAAESLTTLRETLDAHAAWGIVLRDGHAWPALFRIAREEADADWLMHLARTLWHDNPAAAPTQARALAAAATDAPCQSRFWPWLRSLLAETKGLALDPWRDLVEPALASLVEHRGSGSAFLVAAQHDPAWLEFVASRGTQAGWETLLAYDHSGDATVRLWRNLAEPDRAAQTEPLLRACLAQMDWTALLAVAEAEPPMWSGHAELLFDGLLNRMDAARGDLDRYHSLLDAIRDCGDGWRHLARLPGFWARLLQTTGGTRAEQVLCGALDELADLEEAAKVLAGCYVALEAPEVAERVRTHVIEAIRREFRPAASRLLYRLQAYDTYVERFRTLFDQYGIDTGIYL